MMLAATPKLNDNIKAKLIDIYGSAEAIFNATTQSLSSKTELTQVGIDQIIGQVARAEAQHEMQYCAQRNIKMLAATDDEYPTLLRQISNPPHVLFIMGDTSILNRNLVAIVGSRKMTTYGEKCCIKMVEDLAARVDNLVIVSGLAYGVDGAAHRTAMNCNVPTIAVLPCRLPDVIPSGNMQIARQIIEQGGALISEMRSTMRSFKSSFLPRNRIIAALSSASLIIESGASGGARSTIERAAEYGRVAAAIPGRVSDELSQGCNALIARHIAYSVSSSDELIKLLKWEDRCRCEAEAVASRNEDRDNSIIDSLGEKQRGVLSCFRLDEPLHISALSELTLMGVGELKATLMELEIYGAVRSLPGSRYERLVKIDF